MTDQEVVEVFHKITKQADIRLQRGLARRQEMYSQIKRGEAATGFRADFLRQATGDVLDCLAKIGEKFNDNHPDDKISVNDLLDILATTIARLKNA